MKKSLKLAALTLPLVFAACSQEDLFEGTQSDVQQGTVKATFVVENAGSSATRADWRNDQLSFVPADKFSLYWLGAGKTKDLTYDTALKGHTNAVYAQKQANVFESQSLIFEGKNIAVFPADVAHYSVKDMDIKIDAEQTAQTVENLPYISNVLNIQANGDDQAENKPGYEVKVRMPIKQAANVFDMTLNLKNHADLLSNPFNLEVQKVELIANAVAFANEAKVVAVDAEPTEVGEVSYNNGEDKANSIVKQAQVSATKAETTLTSKAIAKVQDGVYTVRFVVLPTDVTDLTATSVIKVYTNCGTVTLTSTDAVYPTFTDDEAGKAAEAAYLPTAGDLFTNKAGKHFTIAEIFESIASYDVNANDPLFKDEKVGRVVKRSIVVDMAKADLSLVEVEDETQLMRYVTLYGLIKKTDLMTLRFVGTGNEFAISKTTAEAVAKLENDDNVNDNIALDNATNSKTVIVLNTAGEVYSIPELNTDATYKLAAGTWTMNDNAVLNACADIETVKDATLTIKGNDGQTLAIDLTNGGTLKIGGNNTLTVASTITSTGNIEIEDGKILNFTTGSEASELGGTVNVYEQLYTDIAGVQLTGTVNNYYIIGADAKANVGFVNKGTINVKESAIATYIHDNSASGACINLNKRNDEVVTTSTLEGKIVYNWNDGETLTKVNSDKFTYLVVNQANLTIGGNLAAVDVEFAEKADCKIVAAQANAVRNVLVNANAAVHLLSGNYLTCYSFTNNGSLTLGGTIDTNSGSLGGTGKVITVSGGQVK